MISSMFVIIALIPQLLALYVGDVRRLDEKVVRGMLRYVFWRLVWIVLILMLIYVVIYFSTSLTMLRMWGRPPYDFREEFAIAYTRFVIFTRGVITEWHWGVTGLYDYDVWDFATGPMWLTMRLNLLALAIYLPLSIILGIMSALRRNSLFDKSVAYITMFFGSIPHFILVLLLAVFLGVRTRILPMQFPAHESADTMLIIKGLVIPMFALCMPAIFKFTRLVRGEFLEAQHDDYLLLCKTKGLSNKQAVRRHAFKNCMVPVLPELVPTFLMVLGGSFFVEIVYGIPGAANLLLHSLFAGYRMDYPIIIIDIPVTMLLTMFYSSFGMMFALLVDISYPLIDPRIHIGSKATDTR